MIRIDSQTNSSHLKDEFQVFTISRASLMNNLFQFVPGIISSSKKGLSSQIYNLWPYFKYNIIPVYSIVHIMESVLH